MNNENDTIESNNVIPNVPIDTNTASIDSSDASLNENHENDNNNAGNVENNNINNIFDNIIDIPDNEVDDNLDANDNDKVLKYSFCFIIVLIPTTLAFIHSFLPIYKSDTYTLSFWAIIHKFQYYRIITNHFYHFSFFHYGIAMLSLYFIIKRLESQIGSFYTLAITLQSIIIISLINCIFSSLFKLFHLTSLNANFMNQMGINCLCFTYLQLYYLLENNKNEVIYMGVYRFTPRNSVLFWMLFFHVLAPHLLIGGHASGVLCAYVIFYILPYVSLPDKEWVKEMEMCFKLGNSYVFRKVLGYVSIDGNEEVYKNVEQLSKFGKFKRNANTIVVDNQIQPPAVNRNLDQQIEMVNEERLD